VSGDLGVTQSLRGSKNDPRSLRITLVGLWSAGDLSSKTRTGLLFPS
jgi:hypothetical protein